MKTVKDKVIDIGTNLYDDIKDSVLESFCNLGRLYGRFEQTLIDAKNLLVELKTSLETLDGCKTAKQQIDAIIDMLDEKMQKI